MKYFKKEKSEEEKNTDNLLAKWEYSLLLTLVILMVMATIVDLDVSFKEVFKLIL